MGYFSQNVNAQLLVNMFLRRKIFPFILSLKTLSLIITGYTSCVSVHVDPNDYEIAGISLQVLSINVGALPTSSRSLLTQATKGLKTEAKEDHLYVQKNFKKTDIMELKAVCRDFGKAPRCDLHEGLQLEVTQHPHSLRQVANLIVMLQRMKHNHTPVGTEFSDDDLLNIMLEIVLEEREPSHFMSAVESRASVFRSRTTVGCSVCDEQQKSWVLNQWPLQLQAVMLQGSNMDLKVNLSLSTYMARSFTDGASRPVALGIAGKDLYLSCSESDGNPVLQLEEITGKEMLKEIDAQGDMVRFLFLRKDSGFSSTTFESLKFRGWFISTAVENRMPVQMCHKEDDTRITCFTIKQL